MSDTPSGDGASNSANNGANNGASNDPNNNIGSTEDCGAGQKWDSSSSACVALSLPKSTPGAGSPLIPFLSIFAGAMFIWRRNDISKLFV